MRDFQPWEQKLIPLIKTIPIFARAYYGDTSDFATKTEAAVFVARGVLQANSDIPDKPGGAASMTLFTLRASTLYAIFPTLDLVHVIRIAERQIEERQTKREREQERMARAA